MFVGPPQRYVCGPTNDVFFRTMMRRRRIFSQNARSSAHSFILGRADERYWLPNDILAEE